MVLAKFFLIYEPPQMCICVCVCVLYCTEFSSFPCKSFHLFIFRAILSWASFHHLFPSLHIECVSVCDARNFCHFSAINYSFICLWFIRSAEYTLGVSKKNVIKCEQHNTLRCSNRPAKSIHMAKVIWIRIHILPYCNTDTSILLRYFSLFRLWKECWDAME